MARQVRRQVDLAVGTVSQSGGIPTGSIIEKGSNANGEYVKFADGTMICRLVRNESVAVTTAYGSLFFGSGSAWTYPAAFTSSPAVCVSAFRAAAVIFSQPNSVSTTGCGVYVLAGSSLSSATTEIYLIAIGRWY